MGAGVRVGVGVRVGGGLGSEKPRSTLGQVLCMKAALAVHSPFSAHS